MRHPTWFTAQWNSNVATHLPHTFVNFDDILLALTTYCTLVHTTDSALNLSVNTSEPEPVNNLGTTRITETKTLNTT